MLRFIRRLFQIGGNPRDKQRRDTPGLSVEPLVVNGRAGETPMLEAASHRTDGQRPQLREIDVSSLSYVPLPRAPLRWEETRVGAQPAFPVPEGHFEVRDADWRINSIERIPLEQRPDPAFRQMHPIESGMLMVDDLGKADGLGEIDAAALLCDRSGKVIAKKRLGHGVYRTGVHPLGRCLIAMSRDCIIHAYDEHLEPIMEASLILAPEIVALRRRFEIPEDQLKNHIRCVALSRDARHYVFTAVDEAWCFDIRGTGLWGAKLPAMEGWTRVPTPSSDYGTSVDVDRALATMGLSLPISPTDVKQRHRQLAKQWHPDLNPGDPEAAEKMKSLNAAMEMLTGIDTSALARYTGATFVREMERQEFELGGTVYTMAVGMQVGEIHASDWIYAAGFAATSNGIYLAGYSGRVVLVDDSGKGVRVYDIGSVPRRVVDTGKYLYLLTDTRLYVLHDDVLYALIDISGGGDLVISRTVFAVVENKRVRCFREDGQYLGSIVSRDPVRRVYAASEGVVVESRQRRAVVRGVPGW